MQGGGGGGGGDSRGGEGQGLFKENLVATFKKIPSKTKQNYKKTTRKNPLK